MNIQLSHYARLAYCFPASGSRWHINFSPIVSMSRRMNRKSFSTPGIWNNSTNRDLTFFAYIIMYGDFGGPLTRLASTWFVIFSSGVTNALGKLRKTMFPDNKNGFFFNVIILVKVIITTRIFVVFPFYGHEHFIHG